jgi:sulfur carrier protein
MVKVNGEMLGMDGKTVTELLESMGLNSLKVAVELNEEIVPRAEHPATILRDGDTVEVVRFVGGG